MLVLVVRSVLVLVLVVRVVRAVVEVEAFNPVFHSLCVGSCIGGGRDGFGNVGGRGGGDCESFCGIK